MICQATIESIKSIFPEFKMVKKSDSLLMKIINVILIIITFNQMRNFMSSYITTIGFTIYTNSNWDNMSDASKIAVIRHEFVHMEQCHKYGKIGFSLLYLFVLPCVFAFYRTKFEKEAYEETIRVYVENLGYDNVKSSKDFKDFIVSQFTGASYMWSWVIKSDIEKWYDNFLDSLKQ